MEKVIEVTSVVENDKRNLIESMKNYISVHELKLPKVSLGDLISPLYIETEDECYPHLMELIQYSLRVMFQLNPHLAFNYGFSYLDLETNKFKIAHSELVEILRVFQDSSFNGSNPYHALSQITSRYTW